MITSTFSLRNLRLLVVPAVILSFTAFAPKSALAVQQDPCFNTTYALLPNYRLPAATFNWNFHYNPLTTPPALSNPSAGQAIMAGAGGWNTKRTHSTACLTGGPSWTSFAQNADITATPGVIDNWNTIGFQNHLYPASNTNTQCRQAILGNQAPAVACIWGTGGFASGTIYQADIVFNSHFNYPWTTDLTSYGHIVQSVSTHEFGHVVGLAHGPVNSTYSGCSQAQDHFALTMYPYYCAANNTGNSYRWYTLAKGDMTGLFNVVN